MEVDTAPTFDPLFYGNNIKNFFLNPAIFIVFLIIILFYLFLFSSLGKKTENNYLGSSQNNGSFSKIQPILGIIIIVILLLLIIANAFYYFFNINISTYISDLFTNQPKVDIVIDQSNNEPTPVPEQRFKKQVYNIPGNYYDYENAKAICNAYGSELATYEQIEHAYKKGGEWCNYGWSADQMALFPTQQKTFDHLQTIPKHEHDCGRPGINGGYIANPNVKFGINCFGNKPKITEQEEQIMNVSTPYPQTAEDLAFQQRVDYWKNNVDSILVSPFNYSSWNS